MESVMKEQVLFPHSCGFCGNAGLNKCARCLAMYYCCREHQRQHWPIHKKTCKKSLDSVSVSTNINESNSANMFFPSPDKRSNSNVTEKRSPNNLKVTEKRSPTNLKVTEKRSPTNLKMTEKRSPSNLENRSPSNFNITKKLSPNNLNVTKKLSPRNFNATEKCTPSNVNIIEQQNPIEFNVDESQNLNLNDACMKVIRDLNFLGICVLNNFMGSSYGNLILEEVENLYKKDVFQKGRLVRSRPNVPAENIRSDVNTWVIGTEPECTNIGHLIGKIDVLIGTCNNMPNNGILSKHKLKKRTKVMVACYPGNGTHYQRHVDNPSKDGRCVTCVYYLNHNWDETHGGVLRAYPCFSSRSYDIEPMFDRLVMFWSNERVPHEVLPAFATRFAVTVWYFDADEREAALKRFAERTKKS